MPDQSYCPKCKKNLPATDIFCGFCGTRTVPLDAPAQNAEAPQAGPVNSEKPDESKTPAGNQAEKPAVPTDEQLQEKERQIRSAMDGILLSDESRELLERIMYYVFNRQSDSARSLPRINMNCIFYSSDKKSIANFLNIYNMILGAFDCYKDISIITYDVKRRDVKEIADNIAKSTKNTLIYIKNIENIETHAATVNGLMNISVQIARLESLPENCQNYIYVIAGEKSKLDSVLASYRTFYYNTFNFRFFEKEISTDDIIRVIKDRFNNLYETEEGFYDELEAYVSATLKKSELKYKDYAYDLIQKILFKHFGDGIRSDRILKISDIPDIEGMRKKDDIWKDINSLTGLENVKKEIKSLERYLIFQKKMKKTAGADFYQPNLHMVFSGNPGTGKTTVARLVAELLYNIGYISQNKLIETSPKDLIAMYLGQTAPKTAEKCRAAYNGVLFIDEAYQLRSTGYAPGDKFEQECLSELIKQMEDNRDKLVVIFAGYSNEMKELMDSNVGLTSRIGRQIVFEDYTEEQLYEIFENLASKNLMKIPEQTKARIEKNIAVHSKEKNFGNARYIRNLYEIIMIKHAENTICTEDPEMLETIYPEDVPE